MSTQATESTTDKSVGHDLHEFMQQATQQMQSEYARIRKRTGEDPGTAGDQGEENWAELLRGWLPKTYHVRTKGRILSLSGQSSPQVDVLVLRPSYPPSLLGRKHYLAGGVAAAFECKNTLKAVHIRRAVRSAVEIRRLLPKRAGSPYRELQSSIVYGLLAHSHDWQRPRSNPTRSVDRLLLTADREYVEHPLEMLDLICVSDLAAWVARKITWVGPGMTPNPADVSDFYDPEGNALSTYACHATGFAWQAKTFTPIGAMLSILLALLAREDDTIQPIAEYLSLANLEGVGGGSMRKWTADIYSDSIRKDVTTFKKLVVTRSWSPWSLGFP